MPDYRNGLTPRERLLSRLIIDPSGCLLWTGGLNRGYGRIRIAGKDRPVHRVMWEMFEGPIPGGLTIDHVKDRGCVHKNCASIAHLEPVTGPENTRRRGPQRTKRALKTHCVNGHEFDLANTMWLRQGSRVCRACSKERHQRWLEKNPGAARDATRRWRARNVESIFTRAMARAIADVEEARR
jgi:hypothetical protein